MLSIALLVMLGTLGEVARLAFGFNTVGGFVPLFGLGTEANAPTWFSSATLLIAALLAAIVALVKYQDGDALVLQWCLFSALLCLMSLDESAVIHEHLGKDALQSLLGVNERVWYVYYAWIAPGIVIVCLIVWAFSTLWRSLDAEIRPRFTRAAVVYFGGALGMEVAEAAYAAAVGLEVANTSPFYTALWTTQELMEMAGVALLILALIDYLAVSHISITMRTRTKGAQKAVARSGSSSRVEGLTTAS